MLRPNMTKYQFNQNSVSLRLFYKKDVAVLPEMNYIFINVDESFLKTAVAELQDNTNQLKFNH